MNILRVESSNIKNFITVIYFPFENLLTKKWLGIYIRLVQVTENYQRLKLFSLLTEKNGSWKLWHNKNIFRLRTLIVFIKKAWGHWMNSVEHPKYVQYQKSKGKNVNKLWPELSNMSINTRLVWGKKKRIITSQISYHSRHTFVDSRFMTFTKVQINELACIFIHVRKICRMTFKMLLLMLLRNCWEETLTSLWTENFRNGTFEKITKTVSLSSKYPLLTLLLNKKIEK